MCIRLLSLELLFWKGANYIHYIHPTAHNPLLPWFQTHAVLSVGGATRLMSRGSPRTIPMARMLASLPGAISLANCAGQGPMGRPPPSSSSSPSSGAKTRAPAAPATPARLTPPALTRSGKPISIRCHAVQNMTSCLICPR